MKIKRNMGLADRVIRLVAAVILGYLYFSGMVTGVLGIILLVLGVIFVLTSLVSFCPIYQLFKYSTAKKVGQ